jgi:hypothetical protein
MAKDTSAAASAGASLMPSPTMPTHGPAAQRLRPPPPCPAGSTWARNSVDAGLARDPRAVAGLSPVSITTRPPAPAAAPRPPSRWPQGSATPTQAKALPSAPHHRRQRRCEQRIEQRLPAPARRARRENPASRAHHPAHEHPSVPCRHGLNRLGLGQRQAGPRAAHHRPRPADGGWPARGWPQGPAVRSHRHRRRLASSHGRPPLGQRAGLVHHQHLDLLASSSASAFFTRMPARRPARCPPSPPSASPAPARRGRRSPARRRH